MLCEERNMIPAASRRKAGASLVDALRPEFRPCLRGGGSGQERTHDEQQNIEALNIDTS